MGGFDTEPAELFAAGARLHDAAADARTALARLSAAADDVVGYGWRGAAGSAFGAGWREWEDGATRALAALDELADAFDTTGREYAAAEHANVMPRG